MQPDSRIPTLHPFRSFDEAAEATLAFLKDHYGFGAWMITRTVGEEWVMLRVRDDHYDLTDGTVLQWSDSFCYRMVRGEGPNIAPDADAVQAYRDAPIGAAQPIKAYIGYPLVTGDGELFGTLCAIDPKPQSGRLQADQSLLELLARFLSGILHSEMQSLQMSGRIANLETVAYQDGMTGLLNRAAWDHLLAEQERKAELLGEPASVVIVDLNGLKQINDTEGHEAGDRYIRRAADLIRGAARTEDVVARLGGDEFGVLLEGQSAQDPGPLIARLDEALAAAEIDASVGWARHRPGHSLADAVREADQRMYDAKRRSKARER